MIGFPWRRKQPDPVKELQASLKSSHDALAAMIRDVCPKIRQSGAENREREICKLIQGEADKYRKLGQEIVARRYEYLILLITGQAKPIATAPALRSLYGFLVRFRYLAESPTKYLESPRPIRNLPPIMDVPTMYRLMKLPNTRTWGGSRDLAMLEVLYSSGVRLSELVGIKLGDLDLGKGTFIVNGKGGQQRECYLNSSARRALRHYLKMTRVSREERIFLNPFGRPITGRSVERIVNAYISRVDSRPGLTVHSIRHTFATHMLESGVNIRDIQEMLGHKNISTTAHYLHISVKHLKQQYDAHMPSILNGQMSLFLTAKGG